MEQTHKPSPDEDSSPDLAREFLRVTRKELRQKLERIEHCLSKLTPEQIWSRQHENENAVGNLVLHLGGNVRQWIISGVGGDEDLRDRDAEFSQRDPLSAAQLMRRFRNTVEEADRVIAQLSCRDLLAGRNIQGYEVTVLHAIYHVVVHFGEHTGQIIWATKRMTGKDLGFYTYLNDESGTGPPTDVEP